MKNNSSYDMSPVRAFRSVCNFLGLAWWAKIETGRPFGTFWFGPFLTKRSLHGRLPTFIDDLTSEGSEAIDHRLVRTRREEPLTS